MVSSLVVIFAVVELLLLPFLAQAFLWQEPLVAAAWMGLAVKTDGAAIASGAITDALIRAKALEHGIHYEAGWMLATTTTAKMFIDVFIGVWAFLLALIWVYRIDKREGDTVRFSEIWQRFPKFVLGYFLTFAVIDDGGAGVSAIAEDVPAGDQGKRLISRPVLRDDLLHGSA